MVKRANLRLVSQWSQRIGVVAATVLCGVAFGSPAVLANPPVQTPLESRTSAQRGLQIDAKQAEEHYKLGVELQQQGKFPRRSPNIAKPCNTILNSPPPTLI
ncbi:hypothetical protein QQ056_08295 [Oscillatoria laete-virens NRMC-F 0139]|nr:hypothetical protein [Oscillatoria laete-virens]MDL5053541.1 hypothetical protein [Oscillatoria laete-virens NRMC-F 0139]